MESPTPPVLPSQESTPRRAAWWCWPVILASVAVFLILAARESAPGAAAAEPQAGEGGRIGNQLEEPDWSLLAIFKIQSQLIIGASAFDPSQAEELLRQLRGYAADVHTTAALAIVTQFAQGEGDGRKKSAEILEDTGFSRAGEAFLDRIDTALEKGVTAEERSELSSELGWFAALLPARSRDGGREAPPQASAIRTTSAAVAAVLGAGMLVAFGAFLLGTGLFVTFLVMLSRGRGLVRFRPDEPGSHFLLEAFAVYHNSRQS